MDTLPLTVKREVASYLDPRSRARGSRIALTTFGAGILDDKTKKVACLPDRMRYKQPKAQGCDSPLKKIPGTSCCGLNAQEINQLISNVMRIFDQNERALAWYKILRQPTLLKWLFYRPGAGDIHHQLTNDSYNLFANIHRTFFTPGLTKDIISKMIHEPRIEQSFRIIAQLIEDGVTATREISQRESYYYHHSMKYIILIQIGDRQRRRFVGIQPNTRSNSNLTIHDKMELIDQYITTHPNIFEHADSINELYLQLPLTSIQDWNMSIAWLYNMMIKFLEYVVAHRGYLIPTNNRLLPISKHFRGLLDEIAETSFQSSPPEVIKSNKYYKLMNLIGTKSISAPTSIVEMEWIEQNFPEMYALLLQV